MLIGFSMAMDVVGTLNRLLLMCHERKGITALSLVRINLIGPGTYVFFLVFLLNAQGLGEGDLGRRGDGQVLEYVTARIKDLDVNLA